VDSIKYRGAASILVNGGYLFGARGITVLARGLYAAILAPVLGPELFGLFYYGISWYLVLLPLTYFGLDSLLSREIGRNFESASDSLSQTLAIRRVLAGAITGVSLVAASLLEEDPLVRQVLWIFSISLAGRSMALWANAAFIACESGRYTFRLSAAFRVAEVLFGIFFVLRGFSILTLAAINAASWWGQYFASYIVLRRKVPFHSRNGSWSSIRILLLACLPIGCVSLCRSFLLQGPIVLHRQISASELELGQLALCIQLFSVFLGVTMALTAASLPVLSRAVARFDGKDTVFANGITRLFILCGGITGLAGQAFGPILVQELFGGDYREAGRLLGAILFCLIPATIGQGLLTVRIAQNQLWPTVVLGFFSAVLLVGSFLVAVPAIGTAGAILAMWIADLTWAVGLCVLLANAGHLSVFRALLLPSALCAGAVGIYYASFNPFGPVVAFALSATFLAGSYLVAGVLTREELRTMKDAIAHWSGKIKPC